MNELSKTFDPAAIETHWYAHWETTNAFRPVRADAPPFTIVMPPPNVTGSLHIGHALDVTLQDILVRRARMQGKDALWVAGTDHAGIATQMVVERQLAAAGDKRANYSRAAFVQKVWDWKAQSGGAITQQLRRLGASCDWRHERFTMDAGFSTAVIKVFVDLFNEGLIYRAKRLVNWDPSLRTAISDLEVETREVDGHMWHFKYPLADGAEYAHVERGADGEITLEETRNYIAIATTRPETMLGDGAIAVHPDDARYQPIVGKYCEIPVGPKAQRRLIPIITDDYPDPSFGSGAVKITGAHDLNDYGVAQRNDIPLYRLMDEAGRMRADGLPYAVVCAHAQAIAGAGSATPADVDALNLVPDCYRGLDRYVARRHVVADIDAEGLMLRIEAKKIMQPFGDRSGVVIEPMLTDQWYVDAKTLAGPAIAAVRSGAIKIVPTTWEKTWFQWLENIQPWCVSRQLWWGHQIPAWFAPDGQCYVAEDAAQAQLLAGTDVTLTQDDDVLDTWFSSALWPFGTLGWPDADPLLAKHYPNDVLISGFDILFFWDARMAMQGLHFMQAPPWKTLYLHGLVRAPDGAKMSKSKGNTVDPLGLIDRYGADALRFTLAAIESQGRDIKLDEKRVEGYRNFATKLWNAARFLQVNGVGASAAVAAPPAKLAVNRWIIGEIVETTAKLDAAFDDFRYDAMADAIYRFAWGSYCDWYIELIKGAFDDETKSVAAWAFDQILVMLHPVMPFVTEELWRAMGARTTLLIHAQWPAPAVLPDRAAQEQLRWAIDVIAALRGARNDVGIAPGIRLTGHLTDVDALVEANLAATRDLLARVGRLTLVDPVVEPAVSRGAAIRIAVPRATLVVQLDGVVDIGAERARLTKTLASTEQDAASLAARLGNSAFVGRAKPEAVDKTRADHAERSAEVARLRAALAQLD